jgi:arylsulfatase A-like enzyme
VALGRGAAQARFARTTAALVPAGGPVLALWDHVLPFHPAASFHWFAHAGVLERFSAEQGGGPDLDAEYTRAVESGGVGVVIADEVALAEYLPGLRRTLARRCRPAVPGYAGSGAWACLPARAAGDEEEPPRATAAAGAPNVVLIVVDTLRLDHLGCYGYGRPTTPNIDALAHAGVLFENPVSQAPWTGASVGSLLTGLQPSVHGLDAGARWDAEEGAHGLPFVVQRTLHPSVPTLAQVLREHGYRTAGFVSNVYLNAGFGFDRGFDVFEDDHADYSRDVLSRKRRGDETNRRVVRWLETGPPEPFFLLVHYNDPHWPYDPLPPHGAEWIAGYRGSLAPGDTGALAEREGSPVTDLGPEALAYVLGLYDGEVQFADANVGALLQRLRALNLRRPLLTVLTADHGEEFLDHGGMSHGYTLYDEQLRVPLIIHFPGRLSARRVGPQVRLIDVMPTVLDLTGVGHAVAPVQGASLVPLVDGTGGRGPGDALSEAPLRGTLRSIRTAAGWKLVDDARRERRELFDLARDPAERADLAARVPPAADALARRIERAVGANAEERAARGLDRTPPNQVVVDETLRQHLEALGYVVSAP